MIGSNGHRLHPTSDFYRIASDDNSPNAKINDTSGKKSDEPATSTAKSVYSQVEFLNTFQDISAEYFLLNIFFDRKK